MRRPNHAGERGSGLRGHAEGGVNIRRASDISDTLTPIVRDRYGEPIEPEPPARIAPYTAEPAIPPVSPAVQGWAKTYGDAFAVELEAARFLSPAELEARLDACKIVAEGRRRRAAR